MSRQSHAPSVPRPATATPTRLPAYCAVPLPQEGETPAWLAKAVAPADKQAAAAAAAEAEAEAEAEEKVDPDQVLLWKVCADGTDEPIYRGRPPPELLQSYGDTVLERPPPDERAQEGAGITPAVPSPPPPAPTSSAGGRWWWNGRWNRAQETSSPSGQLPHNGAANANLNWERGEVGVVGTPATNEATEADEAARLDALHSVDAYDDITVTYA